MFTKSSKYAIKALCTIVAESSIDHKLLVRDVADKTGAPKAFLSKILQQLATKDYISSIKGRNGGFYLTEDQLETPLLDIIVEVEGRDRLQLCAINFENCNAQNPCPVHNFIASAKVELRENFRNIKLKDLADTSLSL